LPKAEKDHLGILPLLRPSNVTNADIIRHLMHHPHSLVLDNKLYMSLIKSNIQNVLDIGTGTGIWAIDFGSE
jgi:ubiquinone/menaquinone biosynthesis C-methylase UbiE